MKDQQSELVLKKKSVPLCQTTRVFRLEALVSVAERTIEALDNFLFDEVMVKSTSEALLRTLADKIEKVKYCTQCVRYLTISNFN